MKRFILSKLFVKLYARIPLRARILRWMTKREGGDMYSLTLRDILSQYYRVDVGNYSYGSLLATGNCDVKTTIGAYVSIGPNVRRFGAAHPLDRPTLHPLFYNPALGLVDKGMDVERSGCWIGHDSWIGANVSILPGCTRIGVGAVIGAGSIVTRDVEDFAVVAGNPARVIGRRFTPQLGELVLESHFWLRTPHEAAEILKRIGREMEKI
ncbi:CatB-related O-acetyltransferase [Arthrobacter sp. NPDC056493]|uniref:CatB-related O-acetyltransferase n=1 Tax=Arthrobacter sp. NPDC056493 TaxID=3345839 RepID=UPI00366DADE6